MVQIILTMHKTYSAHTVNFISHMVQIILSFGLFSIISISSNFISHMVQIIPNNTVVYNQLCLWIFISHMVQIILSISALP